MKIIILLLLTSLTYAEILTPDEVITIRDENTGIREYDYNISSDTYSIDLSMSMPPNPMKSDELTGFRGQLTIHRELFSYIGYLASTDIYASRSINMIGNIDPNQTIVSFTEMGLGLARRSTLINNFLTSKRFYDELQFVITKTTAESEELTNTLNGYGLVSGYGVFWRWGRHVHVGLRASYHIHTLEDDTDPENEIEYSANWMSLDASLGIYF
jgi:hypothetical protein